MMMCRADVTGSMTPTVAKHTQSVEPVVGSKQQEVSCYVHRRPLNTAGSPPGAVTCRDDANVQRARLQSDVWVVLTEARLLLRAADQSVEHLAEHAVPAHAHHAGNKNRLFWLGGGFLHLTLLLTPSRSLTRQSRTGLS